MFTFKKAPTLVQQITLTGESTPQIVERIHLFIQRAQITGPRPECDLVVKGTLNGEPRGWIMTPVSQNTGETIFQSDRLEEQHTFQELRQFAEEPTQELTFTCVPTGSGMRIGIDRNDDGTYDADERAEGRSN